MYFCTMIFYFSATGNSRWAAQRLASATQEHLVDIAKMPAALSPFYLKGNERLGFVFPIHGWRPPSIVRKFIKELQITADASTTRPFTYALCTAGDDIGTTMEEYLPATLINNISLRHLGITTIDSAYSLIMPNTYVGLPMMDVDSKAETQKKLEAAEQQLHTICKEIVDRKRNIRRLHRGRWPWLNSHLLGAIFEHQLITDGPFKVHPDLCVHCGVCAHVCPTGNINGGYGKMPIWQHNGSCLTCFSCYHHCSHHAIDYGSRTKGKGQYFYKPTHSL